MKAGILISAAAVIFLFGFFLMRKLDRFLDSNRRESGSGLSAAAAIKIAFEDPALIPALSELMIRFPGKNIDCELTVFSGSAQEIINKLGTGELDFGFITSEIGKNTDIRCRCLSILICRNRFFCETLGKTVIPLKPGEQTCKILWIEQDDSISKRLFLRELEDLEKCEPD